MDKRTIAVALVLCTGISGCMTTQSIEIAGRKVMVTVKDPSILADRPGFDPHNPIVFQIGDRLVVDQEPLRPTIQQPDGTYVVTWYLVSNSNISTHTSTFPVSGAIVTTTPGAPMLNCTWIRPKAVTCWFNPPDAAHKVWKYQVTVKRDDGGGNIVLDPSVAMD
jgi:hypothetical protein